MSTSEKELKHLGFVRTLAINAVVVVSHLYEKAKQNSGPLKSTVGAVEKAVTTVVGPVYERTKVLPDEALDFLDTKVDEAASKFNELAPNFVKKAISKAQLVVNTALPVVQTLVLEAKTGGVRSVVVFVGSCSKNVLVSSLTVLWYKANGFPPLRLMADMTLPTVTCWSEKYNNFVTKLAARGYPIFGYFPTVPIQDLTKAYKQVEAAAAKKDDGAVSSEAAETKDDGVVSSETD